MKLRTNPAAGLIHDELEARSIPAAKAARDMAIPRSRLSDIFAGRKGVSADTALRFERYLGISAALLIRLLNFFCVTAVTDPIEVISL